MEKAVKESLDQMAQPSKETAPTVQDCTNYDLYLEIQKLRLDSKVMKSLIKQLLNVERGSEIEGLKNKFPFEIPLSKDDVPLCEEFMALEENREVMVSNIRFKST